MTLMQWTLQLWLWQWQVMMAPIQRWRQLYNQHRQILLQVPPSNLLLLWLQPLLQPNAPPVAKH